MKYLMLCDRLGWVSTLQEDPMTLMEEGHEFLTPEELEETDILCVSEAFSFRMFESNLRDGNQFRLELESRDVLFNHYTKDAR